MDLNDKPMATYEDMDAEQRNIGSGLTAILLREIADTGEHAGVFGGKEQEAAAQAILGLHRHIARLRAACKLAMPVLTRWVEWQHGYGGPPYVGAKQASDARDAVIAALEGDE